MLTIHADTSHVIQLAVGPAFMLAAIGGTLTVLTNRLARINDRTIKRRDDLERSGDEASLVLHQELKALNRRAKVTNAAITVAAMCAILVCVLIGSLFLGNELGIPFDRMVASLFVLAMLGLIATYTLMLVEIYLAQHSINPP
ncbi:DUF2721 domain-containing protein [Paracidovorax wautersii]|uniref:DUF2721 domain-containing protein n=1 Tax=Paracidovorax wautersii TaxID=1177982 RepID=UPI0031DE3D07